MVKLNPPELTEQTLRVNQEAISEYLNWVHMAVHALTIGFIKTDMKATWQAECGWCHCQIEIGDDVQPIIHPVSKQKAWVHEACQKEAKSVPNG